MHTQLSPEYRQVARADAPAAALTSARPRANVLASPLGEAMLVVALLAAVFSALCVRLASVVISDMDEGTYLYAGKLVAEGLTPYRDFLLVHPPLAVYLASLWVRLAGAGVMGERYANLAFVLASTVPLYLTLRSMTRSRVAGLLGIVTYTSGILLLANMGRTLKLEPIMDAFLMAAFAIYVLRPTSTALRVVLGMLVVAATLTKLVAVIPIGLIVVGDLLWPRPGRSFVRFWLPAALGAALVALPASVYLFAQPHFLDDVLWSQVDRAGVDLDLRWRYLAQDFMRYPPIPLALAASAFFLARSRDSVLRTSSLVALVGLAALVLLFKTFFTYYIVLIMPWLAIVFVVATVQLARRLSSRWVHVLVGATLVLGIVVPLGYDEAYNRSGTFHVGSPAQIIPILRQGNGPIYAMYPLFALWSERPQYSWYYSADSLIPRTNGTWTSANFIQAFSGSTAVVLFDGELNDYPEAQAYLEAHDTLAYQDGYFSLWLEPSEASH